MAWLEAPGYTQCACTSARQSSHAEICNTSLGCKMKTQSRTLSLGEETLPSYPVSFPWHCLHTFCWVLPQRGTTALKLRQPEQNDRPQFLHPHCGDTREGQGRASSPSHHRRPIALSGCTQEKRLCQGALKITLGLCWFSENCTISCCSRYADSQEPSSTST